MLLRNGLVKTRERVLHYVLLLLFFILLSNQGAGANSTAQAEWTLIKAEDGVSFFYQVADCSGNKVLLLRVVNASTQKVAGHWMLSISSGNNIQQFPGVLMPLESGSEAAANCSMLDPQLSIPLPELDIASLQLSISVTLNPA